MYGRAPTSGSTGSGVRNRLYAAAAGMGRPVGVGVALDLEPDAQVDRLHRQATRAGPSGASSGGIGTARP
jgi:hypothetical protein